MFISEKLEEYLQNHSHQEPELLAHLRQETFQKTIQPYMISGEYQGRFLSFISKLKQPKSILELGTFTGYATLCMAEGLAAKGEIITIDNNPELSYLSDKYFKQSEFNEQINQIEINVFDFLETNTKSFDLIFLDADKENYANYLPLLKKSLNAGGLLITDNVLWYGKVLEEGEKDQATKGIKEFNQRINQDSEFQVIMLPLRDGISLALKK